MGSVQDVQPSLAEAFGITRFLFRSSQCNKLEVVSPKESHFYFREAATPKLATPLGATSSLVIVTRFPYSN